MAQERRRDTAKLAGSRVRASMMFQPCFLAVETKERMSTKPIAPSNERKPPEIFCRSFIIRPSRSAWLLVKGAGSGWLTQRKRIWPCVAVGNPLADTGLDRIEPIVEKMGS